MRLMAGLFGFLGKLSENMQNATQTVAISPELQEELEVYGGECEKINSEIDGLQSQINVLDEIREKKKRVMFDKVEHMLKEQGIDTKQAMLSYNPELNVIEIVKPFEGMDIPKTPEKKENEEE